MSFKKKFERCLEQISRLEESFQKAKDWDILPLSFFSAALDIVNQLDADLCEMEASQCGSIASLLINRPVGLRTEEPAKAPVNKQPVKSPSFRSGKAGKKRRADLRKLLTINQRFMFLRDLFKGNEKGMNQAFTHINALQTLDEALDYLNSNHPFSWETDAAIAFKELLDKHFS
jgi:hypothetical protein